MRMNCSRVADETNLEKRTEQTRALYCKMSHRASSLIFNPRQKIHPPPPPRPAPAAKLTVQNFEASKRKPDFGYFNFD